MTDTAVILEDATPERIAHANDNFSFTKEGARQFADDLLSRMARKGQLYPNKDINLACEAAGRKYHDDWYLGQMSPLAAIDYGKVSGGGGSSDGGVPVSQRVAMARNEYRKARAYLGTKYRPALELLLLQDQDLVGTGRHVSGAASPHACRAVATERFTAALFILARFYGFLK